MSIDKMYKMCFKKRKYTKNIAEKIVKKVKKERDVDLKIYVCPYCQKYHVTKNLKVKNEQLRVDGSIERQLKKECEEKLAKLRNEL